MKRLVVIVLIVALVAGGGFGAWWFLVRDPGDTEMAEQSEQTATDPPSFIELTPLVLPLIQEGQVTQHITYKIVLEVEFVAEDQVYLAKRQLTDAYISELHGLLALRYVRDMENPLPFMERRLLAVSDRLLGTGVINAVLLSELSARKPING